METNDTTPEPKMNPEQLQSDIDTIKNVLSEADKADKDNDIHRIIIAIGNFFCGLFLLIAVPVILIAIGIVGVAAPATQPGEPSPTLIVGAAGLGALVLIAVLALPFLLAGWGVWKKKSWGTVFAFITAILNITNIPLGTALGVFTIWAVVKGKLPTTK